MNAIYKDSVNYLPFGLLQLTLADKHIIESLEDFRKKQIGGVKENKKKFDKKTEKFCQSQERFLNMSTKKPENTIQEVSAQ